LNKKFNDRIFIQLERLHGKSAYGSTGTGIGLVICKKLYLAMVDLYFLKIHEGQRSTFTLPEIQSPVY
jgi:light-regulated signal transduction histidine kinase (bacteriophytochrome)